MKARWIRQDPLSDIEIEGHKKRGKKKLHIDESRVFLEEAMRFPEDPLSMACATMIYTGLRSDEVMGLQVRDLDADGTLLWIEKSKTEAGRRGVELAEIFRPYLQALAKGRQSEEYLFEFKPQRVRACKNERKRRTDALLRKTKAICKATGLPAVCSQSMRGLHSDLAAGFGVTGHAVAKALGHTSFSVTKRHYVDRGIVENANLRNSLKVICRDVAGNCPSETSYRTTQNRTTEPGPEKKNPRVTGG
jgi:integrase